MRQYAIMIAIMLGFGIHAQDDHANIHNSNLNAYMPILSHYIHNTGNATAAAWLFVEATRLLGYGLYQQAHITPLQNIMHLCTFSTDEEKAHAQRLSQMLQEIEQQQFNVTPHTITPLTQETIDQYSHSLESQDPDTVWIIFDKNEVLQPGMPIYIYADNVMVVTSAFLQLPDDQQYSILIHEYSHILHSDVSQYIRLLANNMAASALFSTYLPDMKTWHDTARNIGINTAIQSCLTYCCIQAATWHEIRSDLAAAHKYKELYDGLEYFKNMYDNTPNSLSTMQKILSRILYLIDPHQTNDTRYAYMKEYAETGNLPCYIKARPAYWIGKPLDYLQQATTIFDTPADYCISSIQSGYTFIENWCTRNSQKTPEQDTPVDAPA